MPRRTWRPRLNEQEHAQLNLRCPRERESPRGQQLINNAMSGLRLLEGSRVLVRSRIRLLLMDISVGSFDALVLLALDVLTPEVWVCVLKDTSLLFLDFKGLEPLVLDRRIGQVGSIAIPQFIWDVPPPPPDLEVIARSELGGIPQIGPDGLRMARALVRNGILRKYSGPGSANGFLFRVPKNSEKASMIVHLVRFNKQHHFKPQSFLLPFVEDLSFLVQILGMGPQTLSLGRGGVQGLFSRPLLDCTQGGVARRWFP